MQIWATVALAGFVMAQGASPTIGLAEIERAKALLTEAKGELQPAQYRLLEQDLAEAEAAFQRLSSLAKAGSEPTQVVRGAEALVAAQRVSQLVEGAATVSQMGPLLVALAALLPASTVSQSQERPPKFVARIDLEASLQKLATHAQQVAEQMRVTAPKKPVEPAQEAAGKGKDKCGSCRCFYKGHGPTPGTRQATRADCKEYCESGNLGHPPANGMQCTGDKTVEWWK